MHQVVRIEKRKIGKERARERQNSIHSNLDLPGSALSDKDMTIVSAGVLVQNDLEASGGSVLSDDSGPRQEPSPLAPPMFTVLLDDVVSVGAPVIVPTLDGGGVVDTDGLDAVDLEAGTLALVDDPGERAGGVGTGEDVFAHEAAPEEILILPSATETSDLEVEDTIIREHILDLEQELGEILDSDVFGHFETGDFVVLGVGDVAVIHAENASALLDAFLLEAVHGELGLLLSDGDTSSVHTPVAGSVQGESAPTAADIQKSLALLEVNLVENELELVLLSDLEGLLSIVEDSGSVDHHGAEERRIEIVTAVIMVSDL